MMECLQCNPQWHSSPRCYHSLCIPRPGFPSFRLSVYFSQWNTATHDLAVIDSKASG